MIEENVVAVVVGETSVLESVWGPLHEAKMPVMFYGATGSELLGDTESTFVLRDPLFARVNLPVELAKDEDVKKVMAVVIDVPAALSIYQAIAPPLFEKEGVDLEIVPIPPGTADMTPQMQALADGDTGVVQIAGNDAFCISALNGLRRSDSMAGSPASRSASPTRPARGCQGTCSRGWSSRPRHRSERTTRRPGSTTPL